MSQFTNRMDTETFQVFWAALQRGEFISGAAEQVGTYRKQGSRWVRACGGVRPRRGRDLKGRCLTFAEREEIALGAAGGEKVRAIARRLGRSPSTISRELCRNVHTVDTLDSWLVELERLRTVVCVTAAENYVLEKIERGGLTGPDKYDRAHVTFVSATLS